VFVPTLRGARTATVSWPDRRVGTGGQASDWLAVVLIITYLRHRFLHTPSGRLTIADHTGMCINTYIVTTPVVYLLVFAAQSPPEVDL
jgi:hypothetical protein